MGYTAKQFRNNQQLRKSEQIRDNITASEIAALKHIEIVSSEKMDLESAQGYSECKMVVSGVSDIIANAHKLLKNTRMIKR